jgi:sec-independent protein translocase protein TatB
MFDFSGSEIMVIGVVALVLIGPKDLPVAIRAVTKVLKKMRRMAGEFQHHVDDMMREADLGDVQSTFRDLRGMNLKNAINTMVDPDGSVGRAFSDPFAENEVPPVGRATQAHEGPLPPPPAGPAPSFVPPAFVPPPAIEAAPVAPVVQAPPDFVPPHTPAPVDPVGAGLGEAH